MSPGPPREWTYPRPSQPQKLSAETVSFLARVPMAHQVGGGDRVLDEPDGAVGHQDVDAAVEWWPLAVEAAASFGPFAGAVGAAPGVRRHEVDYKGPVSGWPSHQNAPLGDSTAGEVAGDLGADRLALQ